MGGTVVEIGLPADEFALAETTDRFEDLQYEIERVVAHDDDRVMPYVWIDGPGIGDVEPALDEDGTVSEFERIADVEDECLYRMDWVVQIDALVQILVEEEGAILSAQGNGEDWRLRILFPSREALSRIYRRSRPSASGLDPEAVHDYCEAHGLTMDLYTIYNVDDGRKGRFG